MGTRITSLVPQAEHTPGLDRRVAFIEELRPEIEEMIMDTYSAGTSLAEMAVLILQQVSNGFLISTHTRADCQAYLDEHHPKPGGYRAFTATTEGFVTTVLITLDGGVTATALGRFAVTTMPVPDSANN